MVGLFGLRMDEASLLAPKKIDADSFAAVHAITPHRICFGTTHRNALKPYKGKFPYTLGLPFKDTIGPLLSEGLGIALYPSSSGSGFWHGFTSSHEAQRAGQWINERSKFVYIRDLLDLSAALGVNLEDDGVSRTSIGEICHRAKYEQSAGAVSKAAAAIKVFVENHPPYNVSDCLCAVTPRLNKEYDLPSILAAQVGGMTGLPVISSGSWLGIKPSLKSVSEDQKWSALEAVGLSFNPEEVSGRRVLLLDDLYQSGATANFVAARLKDAGARRVFGLSLVKSRRDSDNQQ